MSEHIDTGQRSILKFWRVTGTMRDSDEFSIVAFAKDENGAIKDVEERLKRNWNIEPVWTNGPLVESIKTVFERDVVERNKVNMSAKQLEEFCQSYPSEKLQ